MRSTTNPAAEGSSSRPLVVRTPGRAERLRLLPLGPSIPPITAAQGGAMTVIDDLLQNAGAYAETFDKGGLALPPTRPVRSSRAWMPA
jgi:hypothetical protein